MTAFIVLEKNHQYMQYTDRSLAIDDAVSTAGFGGRVMEVWRCVATINPTRQADITLHEEK